MMHTGFLGPWGTTGMLGWMTGLGTFAILIGVLLLAFWIWMLVDCAQRKFRNDVEKILWIVVIVLGGLLGALVYLIVVKLTNPQGLAKK